MEKLAKRSLYSRVISVLVGVVLLGWFNTSPACAQFDWSIMAGIVQALLGQFKSPTLTDVSACDIQTLILKQAEANKKAAQIAQQQGDIDAETANNAITQAEQQKQDAEGFLNDPANNCRPITGPIVPIWPSQCDEWAKQKQWAEYNKVKAEKELAIVEGTAVLAQGLMGYTAEVDADSWHAAAKKLQDDIDQAEQDILVAIAKLAFNDCPVPPFSPEPKYLEFLGCSDATQAIKKAMDDWQVAGNSLYFAYIGLDVAQRAADQDLINQSNENIKLFQDAIAKDIQTYLDALYYLFWANNCFPTDTDAGDTYKVEDSGTDGAPGTVSSGPTSPSQALTPIQPVTALPSTESKACYQVFRKKNRANADQIRAFAALIVAEAAKEKTWSIASTDTKTKLDNYIKKAKTELIKANQDFRDAQNSLKANNCPTVPTIPTTPTTPTPNPTPTPMDCKSSSLKKSLLLNARRAAADGLASWYEKKLAAKKPSEVNDADAHIKEAQDANDKVNQALKDVEDYLAKNCAPPQSGARFIPPGPTPTTSTGRTGPTTSTTLGQGSNGGSTITPPPQPTAPVSSGVGTATVVKVDPSSKGGTSSSSDTGHKTGGSSDTGHKTGGSSDTGHKTGGSSDTGGTSGSKVGGSSSSGTGVTGSRKLKVVPVKPSKTGPNIEQDPGQGPKLRDPDAGGTGASGPGTSKPNQVAQKPDILKPPGRDVSKIKQLAGQTPSPQKPTVSPRPIASKPKPPAPTRAAAVPPRHAPTVHRPPRVTRGPSHGRKRMGPETGETEETSTPPEDKTKPPLVLAALDGDLKKVQEMLSEASEINSKDSSGTTALMAAASAGNTEVVKVLLDKAAVDKKISKQKVLDAKDNNGRTALMSAAEEDQPEMVGLLLERGASVNAGDNDGVTVLMIAAQLQQPDIVKLLLKSRANVNAATRDGWTALMLAAAGDNLEVVKLLVEKGANVNARSKDGATPLKVATEQEPDIAKFLQGKGAELEGRPKKGQDETTSEQGYIWILPYWQNQDPALAWPLR